MARADSENGTKRQRHNQDKKPFHETSKENESYHGRQASPPSQYTIRNHMSDTNEVDAVEESEVVTDMSSGKSERRDQKINAGPNKDPGEMDQCNRTCNT